METRANHVWVGIVTLILLFGAAAFFVYLARLGDGANKEYDIFFAQSVGGVAKGSSVSYSGVPVGQVSDISIWKEDPEFVKIRVRLDDDVDILIGTTASVSASFTGVSTISLNGGRAGQPEISQMGPEGVPVIPAAPGALGEILASAPLLLERVATLTERMSRVLGDENQNSIKGILANTDKISAEIASTSPQMKATLAELQSTLAQSTATLAAFEGTLSTTDALLENEGPALAAELRTTLASANKAATALETTLGDVAPLTAQLQGETLPATAATLRDLRRTSETLRELTEQLETQGAASLVSGTALPDYEP